jgi:hypothetical protein
METSTRTGEFEAASIEPASFDPTSEAAPADLAAPEPQRSMVAAIREQCAVCGAAMASDQRYCVECGERRGPARVPMQDGRALHDPATPLAPRPPRQRRGTSVNTTLIAGIGTLLLAMGIGVLIGRSGNNTSAKAPPAQIVTVAGAGAAASGAASQPGTSTPATPTDKSGSTTVTATPKSKTIKKSTAPQPKAVKVGSAGHGKGYQKGHFTGNFFGE